MPLNDVHLPILEVQEFRLFDVNTVKGKYTYYHYGCDGFDDTGWGCGYRTCQTICSWIYFQKQKHLTERSLPDLCEKISYIDKIEGQVPSIPEIQNILVKLGDKPASFCDSMGWIGSVEIAVCIDHTYDVPCRLVHVTAGQLADHVTILQDHFRQNGGPIMMGGNSDNSSKGILGVAVNPKDQSTYLLILDPHCTAELVNSQTAVERNLVSWRLVADFDRHSFYNLCIPLLKWNSQ